MIPLFPKGLNDPLQGGEVAPRGQKRYRTLSSYLKERFDFPVWRVSVDAGFTCPTRDGTIQQGGCLYCYSRGPRTSSEEPPISVAEQVRQGLERLRRRHPAARAIAYFQPYTNTYASIDVLERLYREALDVEGVVGLAVGTRPDCLSEDALKLLESIGKTHEVWLEMGLQTIHDERLALLGRGHTAEQWAEAVERAAGRNIHQVVHLILGLPGEGRQEVLETVEAVASRPIDGLKLHHLMVFEGTGLAELWRRQHFPLITAEAYIDLVVEVLEHLPAEVVIHRLVAEPSPWERLLAPRWRQSKEEILVAIDAELVRRDTRQGARFRARSPRS
jgi:hypothetical protein